ncbi:hypothetical protein D3C85_287570 [compost metagenome]
MVLRAFRRVHLPAQAHGLALVAPEQAGGTHGTFLQRVHEAIADIGPGIGPQQFILLGQHFQQGSAHLALRLRGAARLRILPAAHGHEETHEVFVGRRQKRGGRRQQREDFADGRRRRHVAVRPQPRLVQAQGHVAAAAGGRQHVDQSVLVEFGIRLGNRQHGLRMGGSLHPLQPGGDGIRQRRSRRAGRGNWGFTGFVAGKIHGAHFCVKVVSKSATGNIIRHTAVAGLIHTRSLSSFNARCLKNKYLIRHLRPADGKNGPSRAIFATTGRLIRPAQFLLLPRWRPRLPVRCLYRPA